VSGCLVAACYSSTVALDSAPATVLGLLWDVDPASFDFDRDRALVFERVMTRGTWEAMTWLRSRYSREALAAFVASEGPRRLPPRDLAYWGLVSECEVTAGPGGARPTWAGA